MPGPPERAVARVDLDAVKRNCERLGSLLGHGTELCAVVKADGYGHGDALCARAALAGGASRIAVAAASEARALRAAEVDAPLLVMGALTREETQIALEAGAAVVAWTREFLDVPRERAGDVPAQVHVKLDTGMGRLGTKDVDEARGIVDAVAADDRLVLAGVMTHFATADEPGDDHFPAQLDAFTSFASEVKQAHPHAIVHAANSAGTIREPAAHFDMVRCGVAVYGLDPFQEDPAAHGLEPALSLRSWVASVKRFEPGDSAGYGRSWRATEPTWIGVLPIGYGDGWRRALSNDADVLVRGSRRPLAGTVSMDNVTIDLGPDTDVEVGDEAVLIGGQEGERILCEEVARRLGTINYEVTCGLTARVPRRYEP